MNATSTVAVTDIARVAHETNRTYCATTGDPSQQRWDIAPEWQRKSAIEGVIFHLRILRAGAVPAPSASHESWLETKRREGWRYGPVKRPDIKEHPCFVPYAELPPTQKLKDYLFGAIVKAYFDSGVEIEDDSAEAA
jgi:hypothetical protein